MVDDFDILEIITFVVVGLVFFAVFFGPMIEYKYNEDYKEYIDYRTSIREDLIKKERLENYSENELFKYCLNRVNNISEEYLRNKVEHCDKKVNNITAN